MKSVESRSALGQMVGHIRLVEVVGEGGMGDVYVGYDETLHRKVAVKAIRAEYRMSEDARARFLREARTLSRIDHPGICEVFDLVHADANDYLMSKNDQARLFDPERGREQGLRQFLDEKSFRPGLGGYKRDA